MQLSELIIKEAREQGLEHFFGIPGGGVPLELMDWGRSLGVDFVPVAHESSAAIMAAYYGLLKDTAGLALAVKGVGAGNLVGGAVNTYFERLPVVCCCESGAVETRHLELVSQCSHQRLFEAITKYQATLEPESAHSTLQEAFFQANDGRPGPVMLDIPTDLGVAEARYASQEPRSRSPLTPEEFKLEKLREVLLAAQRPIVLAGADVIRAGALQELLGLVESVGAAVLVQMDAHGVFPESHPRWAGTFVGHQSPNTIEGELAPQADLALLVGCDSLVSDKQWDSGLPTYELVPKEEYESLAAQPLLRVDGDLKASLSRLLSEPGREGFPVQDIARTREKVLRNFRRPGGARLAAQDIIEITRSRMPADGILVSETGIFILMLHHLWPFDQPGRHLCTAGGRTMGLTLPAILGAKLARPETPMVGIGADGSTLMRLGELEVFARTGVRVPLVILNDHALGTMKSRQQFRGMTDYGLDLHPVDLAAIARASGLNGVVVETPEEYDSELKKALEADRTTLIDARVDPQLYQKSFAPTLGILD
jgi:acetolactate synthase-1/2/3 large subunit